jgi:hypothetical protein
VNYDIPSAQLTQGMLAGASGAANRKSSAPGFSPAIYAISAN